MVDGPDLIRTDELGADVGVISAASGDFAIGEENTWSLVVPDSEAPGRDCYVYLDGTEFGGVVDDVETTSGRAGTTVSGRTWHGMLASLVTCPPAGQAHAVLSGEANACIARVLSLSGAGAPFSASDGGSGLTVPTTQLPRYCDAYEAMRRLCRAAGASLSASYSSGACVLSAVPAGDSSRYSDTAGFTLRRIRPVNHLVCLGSGEMEQRAVVHLYADAQGRVSREQSIFGAGHMADVYELSNAEDEAELVSKGTEELLSRQAADEVDMDDLPDAGYRLGQVVTAYDEDRGVSASRTVTKMIARVRGRSVRVEYQVGEVEEDEGEPA